MKERKKTASETWLISYSRTAKYCQGGHRTCHHWRDRHTCGRFGRKEKSRLERKTKIAKANAKLCNY